MVAVSQRVEHLADRGEARDALDQRLIHFLDAAGLIPAPVPNGLCAASSDIEGSRDALGSWLEAIKPQGFVLSGGDNIGLHGDRDLTEERLLNHARQYQKPLLGICRGMQMMGVWAGMSLRPVQGHIGTRHSLYGKIYGDVNSFHGLSLAACPEGFELLAKSEDGEIEAMCHQSLPWEGWMWHPEREESYIARDIHRVRALFDE